MQALRLRITPLEVGIGGLAISASLLIATQSLPVALGLLLVAAMLLGTLIDPVVGLLLTVGTVLVQELVPLPLDLTVTHIVGAMALGTWLLHGLARHEIRIETPLLLVWGLFLAALLLSAGLTQYNAVDSLKQVMRWVLAFLAFVITVSAVRTPGKAAWLVGVILLAGVVESLVGIGQYVLGAGPFGIGEDDAVRAYGTIGKPNTFAGFLEMIWPLAVACGIGLLIRWWRKRTDMVALVGALAAGSAGVFCLAGVGVSFSRGGWLGSLAGLVVMLALAGRRQAVPWLAVGAALVSLLFVAPDYLPATISERAASITNNLRIFDASQVTVDEDNFAVVERMAHWQAGARMFVANPWIGVGPDNFNRAYPEFFVGRWSESQGHAHNYYIHIAAEGGLVGIITYLLLIGAVVRTGWRAVEATKGTPWHAVAIGGCGIIAAVQVHNVFENLHVLNFGIHLSAVWGLLTVLGMEGGWRSESIS